MRTTVISSLGIKVAILPAVKLFIVSHRCLGGKGDLLLNEYSHKKKCQRYDLGGSKYNGSVTKALVEREVQGDMRAS